MAQTSAGILLYRRRSGGTEVLLVHPGGPFWRARDQGAWMIPKGGIEPGEEPLAAAIREFEEELGSAVPGIPRHLGRVRQAGGKSVEAFAAEGEFDTDTLISNLFEMEWPPRSGIRASFPEVDRANWFTLEEAGRMILPSQRPLLDALMRQLD